MDPMPSFGGWFLGGALRFVGDDDSLGEMLAGRPGDMLAGRPGFRTLFFVGVFLGEFLGNRPLKDPPLLCDANAGCCAADARNNAASICSRAARSTRAVCMVSVNSSRAARPRTAA